VGQYRRAVGIRLQTIEQRIHDQQRGSKLRDKLVAGDRLQWCGGWPDWVRRLAPIGK
jgi:hypothetical protein